jgi:large subunit ribosomal protein L18
MRLKNRKDYQRRRHLRVRQKIRGTSERPRLSIMVSNRHVHAQLIDDDLGKTLAAASTESAKDGNNVEKARVIGKSIAEAAVKQGVRMMLVDRGGFKYHGRVRSVVEGALEGGLAVSGTGKAGLPDASSGDEARNEEAK